MKTRVSVSIIALSVLVSGWLVGLQLDAQAPGLPTTAFDGLIEASRVINLTAPVDGLIDTVQVERGDTVEKGQVVATLESTVETATWELAKARATMEAEQRSRRARLEFLSKKLERDEELHTKGVVSDDELELSRTECAVARELVKESDERRKLSEFEEKRAAALLALRTVQSPLSGVVTERLLSKGELVTRQHQSKILQIAQIDPLIVNVIVPAELFGQIEPGITGTVVPIGPHQQPAKAVVKMVDRVIDARSDTFRVSLELPNPDQRFPAGVKCTVSFGAGR